jgi:hypothetical protein
MKVQQQIMTRGTMNRVFHLACLSAVLATMIGCATRPVSNANSVAVPASRSLSSQFLQEQPGTGRITVKRDSGLMGSACAARVYIDGQPMADLRTSESTVRYLPVGPHIVSVEPSGPCGGGLSEVAAEATVERPLSFRIGYGSNGDYSINPTAF